MKHKRKLTITLGVLAALAVGSYAIGSYAHSKYHGGYGGHERSHHDGGMQHGAKRMIHMLEKYDANKDGALAAEEIRIVRTNEFKKFDADGDGNLSIAEYEKLWAAAMRERMVDRFQKYDNDGDGKITEADYASRYDRKFSWMDRNGDGKIDREDMHRHNRGDND